jgi:hypothetical protein
MSKPTCESVYRISIGRLISALPKNSLNQNSFLQFETRGAVYSIELVSTPCFFGGKRYWFKCPSCKKRVGVLYKRFKYFSCRTCSHLVYQSQQRTHTGSMGVFEKCFFTDWDEMEEKIRVKHWRGKTTRRYQRLLNRMHRNLTPETADSFEKIVIRKH